MNVASLIKILQYLPQEKTVMLFWDGGARGDIEGIVNDDESIVLVGDWSIYRDGTYREYAETKIIYG